MRQELIKELEEIIQNNEIKKYVKIHLYNGRTFNIYREDDDHFDMWYEKGVTEIPIESGVHHNYILDYLYEYLKKDDIDYIQYDNDEFVLFDTI